MANYHRTDGPAIEFANGDKHWYINGKYIEPMDLPLNRLMVVNIGI